LPWWVSASPLAVGGSRTTPNFNSIQGPVNVAAAGGTIVVCDRVREAAAAAARVTNSTRTGLRAHPPGCAPCAVHAICRLPAASTEGCTPKFGGPVSDGDVIVTGREHVKPRSGETASRSLIPWSSKIAHIA